MTSRFVIGDDHGTPLWSSHDRDEALKRFRSFCEDDQEAQEDCALFEFGANGGRLNVWTFADLP